MEIDPHPCGGGFLFTMIFIDYENGVEGKSI
jgi:hypothetical protein